MASSLFGNPKEKWIRSFTVTEPTKHVKGFTVYKVSYKAFSLNRPDDVIEIVVWKRYNDFKKLHKSLSSLHFHLRRPEKFPEFAKAKFFGRFDDQVIDERRKSALRLLEFAATVPPLTRNVYFTKFFEGGEELTSTIPPQKTTILQPHIITPVEEEDTTDVAHGNKDAVIVKESGEDLKEQDKSLSGSKNGYTPPLGGIWLHRQAEDEEAIDYGDLGRLDDDDDTDDDDRTTFSEDSVPSTPLPQLQDLSLFDPLSEDMPDSIENMGIPHSNSWLFRAMDVCAELNQDTTDSPQESGHSITDASTDSGITINFSTTTSHTFPSDASISDSAVSSVNESNSATQNFGLPSPVDSSSQALPGSKEQRSSMARAYLNSIRAQHAASVDSAHHGPVDTRSGPGTPEKKSRTDSTNSTSSTYSAADVEIGGVEDYLYQAARHISLALDNEANGNYQMAFDLYKEGVGILLKGVIGDNNKTRREAVRRKTAQYLMKAEDLYNNHLSTAAANARRWESQKMIVEFDSSSAHLKVATEELKNFKVLGIIDRVLLVLDMVSYQTYAIKVLRKYSVPNKNRRTVVPADCPYMVKLYKYFETDCSLFLVLEHATGGKLWSYASAYLHHDLNSKVPFVSSLERSLGSRGSKRSRTSSSISGLEERVRRISGGEDNVFDEDSPRKNISMSSSKIESVPEDVKNKFVQSDDDTNEVSCDPKVPIASENELVAESATFVPENNSTPLKNKALGLENIVADITSVGTEPVLSESPEGEVASSYANIFNYTKKVSPASKDSLDDFMHIEDTEDVGSNLNDLLQVSSQYDDVSGDDTLGLSPGDHNHQSLIPPFSDNVFTNADDSSHNKSFNTTVQQVNTQPPPMTLFSIDSSESPDVQSAESSERPSFRYSDNSDLHGSLEGLGQLQEELENDDSVQTENKASNVWEDHDPDNVMADAMKAMQELEEDDMKTPTNDKLENSRQTPLDTSGFGEVFEDSTLSAPGTDLAEFFENSGDSDRRRTVSSPSHGGMSYGNRDYDAVKRTTSIGNDQEKSATSYPFMGISSPSSGLGLGHRGSFGSSEPKSSIENLLEPSDTRDIESEWEKSARMSSIDTGGLPNQADQIETNLPSHYELKDDVKTDYSEQSLDLKSIRTNPSTILPESGALSGNESAESSTTPKELPSSIYSSTQSTPKHSLAANSKIADWPGDVETDVQKQLAVSGSTGTVTNTSEETNKQVDHSEANNRKSKMPETRLPSLATFLAQMDEATAKHASLTTLPESCVRMWAAEIVIALANLHAAGIICKDLRPHNILLAEGGHIRLTYFSQWKCVEPELSSYACDHFYTAPEVKGVYEVTEACDWWSLGAILFELLTSKSLYVCHPSGVNSHTQLNIPDHVSTEAKGLLAQLLQVNPSERLGSGMTGLEDIRAHPFFYGINWTLYKG